MSMDGIVVSRYIYLHSFDNPQKICTEDSTSTKICGLHFLRNCLIYMDSHIPTLTESRCVGATSQSQSQSSLSHLLWRLRMCCSADDGGKYNQNIQSWPGNPVHRVTAVFHRVTENWLNVFYARIKFSLVTEFTLGSLSLTRAAPPRQQAVAAVGPWSLRS